MQLTFRLPSPAVVVLKLYCCPRHGTVAKPSAANAYTPVLKMLFSFRTTLPKANPSRWNEFNIYLDPLVVSYRMKVGETLEIFLA